MARIRLPTRNGQFLSILKPLLHHHCPSSNPPKTLTMAVSQSNSKRPTCPSCSKPLQLCLCTRIQNPGLENKVGVTILHHSLEKKHPLNSVRIAKLGLQNLTLVTVSDVNFTAQFDIEMLKSGSGLNESESPDLYEDSGLGSDNECISFSISKYGEIGNIEEKLAFNHILASDLAVDAISKGFTVKKLLKKLDLEENQEFEVTVPSGSVLLFPSEAAVGVSELKEMKFEVKNLIVLDGTWSKAKRMYKENPWLKFVPHLKLDLDKLSLYNEVRHQPNAGCLSTIESIVYALKAVGEDDVDGLDNLLDVFESMVGDQRRCKNERLSKISPSW
ncbi:uncharacterized protein LOC126670154 [Mercurialis annua]|uniref:uncharacterized protein LOC126670154 n=1 Tax=Mercurialis annua TaxID=3986 RepID=UPI0021606874|nr:uncharacterized protein LOC126670154 [Mercurialis annua]